jgi:Domain of unknown function (DUF1906)
MISVMGLFTPAAGRYQATIFAKFGFKRYQSSIGNCFRGKQKRMRVYDRLKAAICGFIFLVAFPFSAHAEGPPCEPHKQYSVADFSQPITQLRSINGRTGFEELKHFGVKTIIRYYDLPDESFACKTLVPEETDAILKNNFNIAVVFQHDSPDPETFFKAGSGKADAKRALELAAANGQPFGSAIYFSVDGTDQSLRDVVFEHGMSNGKNISAKRQKLLRRNGQINHIRHYANFLRYHSRVFVKPVADIRDVDILPFVDKYFRAVHEVFKNAGVDNAGGQGYKIGAYGSGLICSHLQKQKLVDYCWLAQSTGWPGYQSFRSSQKWSLIQAEPTYCKQWKFVSGGRVAFDFSRTNPAIPDFGQWSTQRKRSTDFRRPLKCAVQN